MFEFQGAAADLPDAEATVHADGALRNQHVSPDLVTATPPVSDVRPDRHALLDAYRAGSTRDTSTGWPAT